MSEQTRAAPAQQGTRAVWPLQSPSTVRSSPRCSRETPPLRISGRRPCRQCHALHRHTTGAPCPPARWARVPVTTRHAPPWIACCASRLRARRRTRTSLAAIQFDRAAPLHTAWPDSSRGARSAPSHEQRRSRLEAICAAHAAASRGTYTLRTRRLASLVVARWVTGGTHVTPQSPPPALPACSCSSVRRQLGRPARPAPRRGCDAVCVYEYAPSCC